MKLPQFAHRPSFSLAPAIVACFALFITLSQTAAAATLTITPSSIRTGTVAAGQSATFSSTLSNGGPETVIISKAVSSSSAYTVIAPSFPLTLAAGQSANVTIQYSPKAYQWWGNIVFTSNAANPNLILSLNSWGGFGSISASPSSLTFGSVQSGSSGSAFETLTNSGSSPLTISSVSSSNAAFSSKGINPPVTLAAGGSITFKVLFSPTASGAATGSLSVVTNSKNRTLSIPLSGNTAASGSLSVSPTSANLGTVTVGTSKTTSATLAASGSSVVVSAASTTNAEFTVSGISLPLTIPAGSSVTIAVNFSPKTSGSATGTLSFASNATNSPAVESLTGSGAAATQHEAALSWNASSSIVSGYNVYRGSKSGGPYSKVSISLDPGTTYSDATVQAGQTYYYVVTGVNSGGAESTYSNQVTAVVP